MRLLQISQRPQRRGAEVFAYQLSAELRRRGHEVATAYLYPPVGDGTLPLEPGDRLLDGNEHHRLETLIGVRPTLLRRLERLVSEFQPDITQVNGGRTVKYGALAHWLHQRARGAVVYRNVGTSNDWVRGVRRRLFYRWIFRKVDGVVAISRGSLEALRPAFPRRTPYTVISNAIDPGCLQPVIPRQQLRAATGTPAAAPVALFVGSLAPEKRVDRLLEAVAGARHQVSELRLWIVGDGPLRGALERHVERAGIRDVVRFCGATTDVASYIAAADLLVLTSDTEGVPAVVLEAGYLRLPVVATRVGSVPECVVHEETGLLVARDDRSGLVRALTRVATDAELRARLGRHAHEWVRACHTMEKIANQYLEFYDTVRHTARRFVIPSGATDRPAREMELLVHCARLHLDPERQARVRLLLQQGPDTDRLMHLAAHHKMVPLLHWHLRDFTDAVRSAYEHNAQRILELTGEVLEIVWLLEEHGILSVPYKGPALAAQLYGNASLRHCGDLDLVVRRADVRRARELLATRGYRPRYPLSRGAEAFMLQNRYHETFEGARAIVELHWAFTNRDVALPLDLDTLLPRLTRIPLGGHVVHGFAPQDLLLLLCVHGAKHWWDRLEWLCGVAELTRTKEVDCGAVLETATRLGVRRMLLLGLGLAHDVLQAPLPQDVVHHVRSDRPVTRMAAEIACRLRAGERARISPAGSLDLFRLRLRERPRDRLRFLLHRLLTPSDPERWAAMAVGAFHIPLHGLWRPGRLVARTLTFVRHWLGQRRRTSPSG